MRKIIKLKGLIVAFLIICNYSYGQQITSAEYFFDADPGVGKGTAITITSPGDSVDVISSINLTGLSAGFHALFIRAKTGGVWSLYQGREFYVNALNADSQVAIINAEYFFDNDPGVGKGTPISTGAVADSVDILSSVSTSALSQGFHALYIRVRNQSGVWSLYEEGSFYINTPATDTAVKIVNAEYFFDTDPGVGHGTSISTGAAADSVDILSNVSTNALSPGFHAIYVRVENQSNVWSLYQGRSFYINTAATDTAVKIVNAEYFFDIDPGVGHGTPISTGAAADSVDILSNVSTSALSPGFHSIYVRVENQSNVWSLYQGRSFYINTAATDTAVEIISAEYFFDSDPGIGNGTPISTGAAADSVDILSNVNLSGLPIGFHTLYVRVENQSRVWSLYQGRSFYINSLATDTQLEIVNAEYFFDSDPGVGHGTPIVTGAPADSIDITTGIAVAGLSTGFHALFIRAQNQSGVWSLYQGKRFYVDTIATSFSDLIIVNAETYFDKDPGVGNGTVVTPSFTPADSVDLFRSVSAGGLLPGTHYLMLRVQNLLGKWSLVMGDTLHICGPLPAFKYAIIDLAVQFTDSSKNATSYDWHFGDGDSSTAASPSHTYASPGIYNVTLIVTDSCGTDSITQVVNLSILGISQSGVINDGAYIYPNPNKGSFMLLYHLPSASSELQIMDIAGRIVYNEILTGNEGLEQINTSDLSNGIFYWRIVSDDKPSANGKIVIVK